MWRHRLPEVAGCALWAHINRLLEEDNRTSFRSPDVGPCLSHTSAYTRCLARKVCGPVRPTWGTSQGEDKLGAGDRTLNTKVARRTNIPQRLLMGMSCRGRGTFMCLWVHCAMSGAHGISAARRGRPAVGCVERGGSRKGDVGE